MRVLLVGAGGRMGLRLVAALIAHGHTVFAYVRNKAKLEAALPASILPKFTIVTGDAEDVPAMKAALLDNDCDAVICTAGFVSVPFQQPTRLGYISNAVAQAAIEAGEVRGTPLRGWWMSGTVMLDSPVKGKINQDFWPSVAPEYGIMYKFLLNVPLAKLRWSILNPSGISPKYSEIQDPAPVGNHVLLADGKIPLYDPEHPTFRMWIPVIGVHMEILSLVLNTFTQFEELADVIAADLASGSDQWLGKRVGVRNDPAWKEGESKQGLFSSQRRS